ncbi:hypothetical protein N5C79_22555 [Pantoea brenneri]|uniref:hypothetical protein n=1 Tax=Pantoea brenneri TaxID=472694 RepID=UPI00244C84E6|nr:hypothetical protein [Pantoea brenneri]MDH1089274.1 hypothetical protein [Pantoea brenneri]
MTNEKQEDVKKTATEKEPVAEKVKFISTDEDEQEGNFEFLCCRGGGTHSMGGAGRW